MMITLSSRRRASEGVAGGQDSKMAVLVIVSARQEGNEAIEATRQHLAGEDTPKFVDPVQNLKDPSMSFVFQAKNLKDPIISVAISDQVRRHAL
jgi:hypothetical protein